MQIPAGAAIRVFAEGVTTPLLGEEKLLGDEVSLKATELLARRGFSTTDDPAAWTMRITYRTELQERLVSFLQAQTGSIYTAGAGSSGYAALGVIAAASVASAAQSWTSTVASTRTEQFFRHTLSLELLDPDGEHTWKGESAWSHKSVDLREGLPLAMQLLLARLPRLESALPWVAELQDDKVENFLKIEMGWSRDVRWLARRYACPALPFPIDFYPHHRSMFGTQAVDAWQALPAFIDLMQTAEYALPAGRDFSDPLDPNLWTDVQLGASYRIGPGNRIAHILIDLAGEKTGYVVTRCRIVESNEFAQFEQAMREWQRALADYYSVYR